MNAIKGYEKDPIEELDYGFNLTDWLTDGELIASVIGTADPPGLVTVDTPVTDGQSVVAWVSGGTLGDHVRLSLIGTTNSTPPRVFKRSLKIHVEEK